MSDAKTATTTTCECGWQIRRRKGEWVHVATGLVGCGTGHDKYAQPAPRGE